MSTYFTPPSVVVDGTTAQASDVNDLSVATAAAFDTLAGTGISGPAITAGDAYKVPQVNSGETSLEYVDGLRVDIDAADGTQILSNGTDGTDATLIADVTGDVTGNASGSSGSCTGNSATATTAAAADTVTTVDESADTTCYLGYFNAATGDQAVKTGTNLTFNSSTGELGATSFNGGIVETGTGSGVVHTKIVEIGDWDMVATAAVSVSHGLTMSKIRSVQASIVQDTGTAWYDLMRDNQAGAGIMGAGWNATDVSLYRSTGGSFDDTDFDSTSFNRGFITIQYIG